MTIPKLNSQNQFGEKSIGYKLSGDYVKVVYQPASPYAVTLADGLIINKNNNDVDTLPAATGSGRKIKVLCQGTVVNIYPQAGEQIDALGAGNQYQLWLAALSTCFTDVAPGQWLSGT
jgi:hypothetical protein